MCCGQKVSKDSVLQNSAFKNLKTMRIAATETWDSSLFQLSSSALPVHVWLVEQRLSHSEWVSLMSQVILSSFCLHLLTETRWLTLWIQTKVPKEQIWTCVTLNAPKTLRANVSPCCLIVPIHLHQFLVCCDVEALCRKSLRQSIYFTEATRQLFSHHWVGLNFNSKNI